ncbi:MAG: HlyD family efflux transporter periplasmic adaptor subunit [Geitlerinemataceae cyanobacterium]
MNQIERLESIEDQPVILEQPAFWTRAFIWLIVGMTITGLIWAAVAKIDLSVPAQGKLEPEGSVKDLRLPIGGVVKEIHVEGGQEVREGDLLITLDSRVSRADVESLENSTQQRRDEIAAYQAQANGLDFVGGGDSFARNQQQRIAARRAELDAQSASADGQIDQIDAQIEQTRDQIAANVAAIVSAEERLAIARNSRSASEIQLSTIELRLEEARQREQRSLTQLEEERAVLADLEPLLEEGGIARLQVTRQRQQVLTREQEVSGAQDAVLERQASVVQAETERDRLEGEISSLEADLIARRSERERLASEVDRLNGALDQARAQKTSVAATAQREAFQTIAENQKQETQLEAQLARAEQQVEFTELRSPVDGVIHSILPTTAGYVITTAEPVVEVIPDSKLVANVFVTNRDIGFIEEGMEVELQLEAFPATEFGTIPGTLTSIGDDVLEPEPTRQFFAFAVAIELDQQFLELKTGKEIPLQAGMAVNANIKLRERSVLSLFLDRFTGGAQNLENLR